MPLDPEVLREIDQRSKEADTEHARIRQELDRIHSDMRAIDNSGTRGVQVLQATVTGLVAQVAEMKASNTHWQEAHEKEHKDDAVSRIRGRRWMVTTSIALGALLVTTVVMLAAVLQLVLKSGG